MTDAKRWTALADYRAAFDRALAEARTATDRFADIDSDWEGPAKARQEISEAINKVERDYPSYADCQPRARRGQDG